MGAKQRYDVAISFAGEDREKASALADALKRQNVAVFYDHYEDLWGLDLYSRLADVYQNQARYCVLFISQHYAAKVWTGHELRLAQARAFQESREYILPVRLDDTEITGIPPTVGFLRWPPENERTIAEKVLVKLGRKPVLSLHPPGGLVPAITKPDWTIERFLLEKPLHSPLPEFGATADPSSSKDFRHFREIMAGADLGALMPASPPKAVPASRAEKKPVPYIRVGIAPIYFFRRDWEVRKYLADGITTPEILEEWNRIKLKERNERKRIGLDTRFGDSELNETRRILKAMEAAKAEAVDYLPEEYKDFPVGQRRLIVELLNLDDPQHTSSQGALNNTILRNARSRIYDVADKKSLEASLKRIDELEEALGF